MWLMLAEEVLLQMEKMGWEDELSGKETGEEPSSLSFCQPSRPHWGLSAPVVEHYCVGYWLYTDSMMVSYHEYIFTAVHFSILSL